MKLLFYNMTLQGYLLDWYADLSKGRGMHVTMDGYFGIEHGERCFRKAGGSNGVDYYLS